MIRLPDTAGLSPVERFGLAVLLDSSRLLPVTDPSADVVRLSVSGDSERDGAVSVPASELRRIGEIAGGASEQASQARDLHDRVPPEENPLVASGQFREPVVSRAGADFRKAVQAAAGRRPLRCIAPWPDGRRWAVALTHDLDLVAGWPSYTLLRAAQLASRLHLVKATQVLAAGAFSLGRDPVWRGVDDLLRIEGDYGVRSTWFVICGTPTFATMRSGDVTYSPESPVTRRIVDAVSNAGHEIGLHGSFETMLDGALLADQRSRLAAISGPPAPGVRQHFLRMRPGATQRGMIGAGFTYDSTWGFSDRNGFRLGTADVVPGWDAERGAESRLEEVPLVWMDRALSNYAGIEDPERWVDDALELARACRDVNGLWTGLWHPNLTAALGFPGAAKALRRLLDVLIGGSPYVERLDRIVEWRKARRSLRATSVSPDGRAELAGGKWAGQAVLEDPRGAPAISQPWPARV